MDHLFTSETELNRVDSNSTFFLNGKSIPDPVRYEQNVVMG